MLCCPVNVTYLLDVTQHLTAIHFITFAHSASCYSKSKIWLLHKHPTNVVSLPVLFGTELWTWLSANLCNSYLALLQVACSGQWRMQLKLQWCQHPSSKMTNEWWDLGPWAPQIEFRCWEVASKSSSEEVLKLYESLPQKKHFSDLYSLFQWTQSWHMHHFTSS